MHEADSHRRGHVCADGRISSYKVHDFRIEPRPAILVVIPYYNAADWIGDCLAMLADNDEPHDILIVNDGGQPVLDVIEPRANLVVCRFEANMGLIGALNYAAGFALDEGYRYYVRQDADDVSTRDRLRLQRAAIERDGADLVTCGVRAVDEHGRMIWSGAPSGDQHVLRKALAVRNPVVHSTWFLRTDLFARIGCYDSRFKGAEDFELLQRIVRQGRISVIQDELVHYLIRSDSILSSSRLPALQTLRVVARYFEPRRMTSYAGIVRASAAAMASRRLKTRVRRLLRRAG